MQAPIPGPAALVREASQSLRRELSGASDSQATHAPRPPALLRGFSGANLGDKTGLGAIVLQALSSHTGWSSITDGGALDVKDVSGLSGSKTYKVTPPAEVQASPPAVALHERPSDHDELFMKRMGAACNALASADVAPRRLAEGGDWFIEAWDAVGPWPEDWACFGELLARVHQVPTDWFEEFRTPLDPKNYGKAGGATPPGSHAWVFIARGLFRDGLGSLTEPGLFADWAESGPIGPVHPAAKQVVTVHGDYHPGNTVYLGPDRGMQCVDFEFTCVGSAIWDLSFGYACCGGNLEHAKVFLTSYLTALGQDPSTWMELALDACLGILFLWHSGGKLPGWEVKYKSPEEAQTLIKNCKEFAAMVRADETLQERLGKHGLYRCLSDFGPWSLVTLMNEAAVYKTLQQKLEEQLDAELVEFQGIDEATIADAIAAGARLVTIKLLRDPSKALQLRVGTNSLELGDVAAVGEGNAANQQFLWQGEELQHVASGLFMDAEVRYCHHTLGRPWESCSGELSARPRDGSDRQRWFLAAPEEQGLHREDAVGRLIRHSVDGRAMEVNAWKLFTGQGVNVGVPHTSMMGMLWQVEDILPQVEMLRRLDFEGQPNVGLSWPTAAQLASEAGGRLPTVAEVIKAGLCTGDFDQWLPVHDRGEELWIQTGNAGRLYRTEVPERWGSGNEPHSWRPTTAASTEGSKLHHFFVADGQLKRSCEGFKADGCPSLAAHVSPGAEFLIRPAVLCERERPPVEVDFEKLKALGGVSVCWLVENSKGEHFVQHNDADGSFTTYPLGSGHPCDQGRWLMKDSVYTEETSFPVSGALHGDAASFFMDVDCGPHGPHKYRFDGGKTYNRGFLANDPQFDLCLAVRSDGYTKDPFEVYLAKTDASDNQKWRVVDVDRIQHVATGRFLHSRTMYAILKNAEEPWEGNHTNLVTRPSDGSDAQRWLLDQVPDSKEGWHVLRHFKDGRVVDVHNWQFGDGGNVGCENAAHSYCLGCSFSFCVVDDTAGRVG